MLNIGPLWSPADLSRYSSKTLYQAATHEPCSASKLKYLVCTACRIKVLKRTMDTGIPILRMLLKHRSRAYEYHVMTCRSSLSRKQIRQGSLLLLRATPCNIRIDGAKRTFQHIISALTSVARFTTLVQQKNQGRMWLSLYTCLGRSNHTFEFGTQKRK